MKATADLKQITEYLEKLLGEVKEGFYKEVGINIIIGSKEIPASTESFRRWEPTGEREVNIYLKCKDSQ